MSRLRLTRRRFAALGLAATFATPARADFPDKPIRLLAPFAPGGAPTSSPVSSARSPAN